MNIAVIGGAGFVGSALVRALLAQGHVVTVFDNVSRGSASNLPTQAALIQMDAKDLHYIGEFDTVYDLAARVYGVRDLYKNPADLLADNIAITTAIARAAVRSRIPRYVYVSSSCVYDFPGAVVPHREEDTNICDTSYGFSKLAGEQIVRWYARQYEFELRIVRLFNVFGPGDSMQSPHVIPEFIRKAHRAKETGTFEILGSGAQTRDFTWLDDCVRGILAAAIVGISGEVYNVGTGREVSILDLANIVCDIVGVQPQFVHGAVAKEDIQRRSANSDKLKGLGWTPEVSLEEGVRRLVMAPLPEKALA